MARITTALDKAKTLIWNGPARRLRDRALRCGHQCRRRHAAERSKAGALVSVAGGGDTVAALNKAGAASDFTYISTAGGAFLEWMEGKTCRVWRRSRLKSQTFPPRI